MSVIISSHKTNIIQNSLDKKTKTDSCTCTYLARFWFLQVKLSLFKKKNDKFSITLLYQQVSSSRVSLVQYICVKKLIIIKKKSTFFVVKKRQVIKLVCLIRFWNNHQVLSKSEDWKLKYFKCLGAGKQRVQTGYPKSVEVTLVLISYICIKICNIFYKWTLYWLGYWVCIVKCRKFLAIS